MIDVIVPVYNDKKNLKKLLFSLAIQKNVKKLNIVIVNDGSQEKYDEEIDFFIKFMNIKEIGYAKNKGPGYARQFGLSNTNNEYIIFADSDDIFSSPNSIYYLEQEIIKNDCDIVVGTFVEECDGKIYNCYSSDFIALHGKIFKRKFIEKNNITFPYFYGEEDNAFINLFLLYNPSISFLNKKVYVWLNNKCSLVRKNNYEYNNNVLEKYIKAMKFAIENGVKNHCNKKNLVSLTYKTLLYIFFSNNEIVMKSNKDDIRFIIKVYLENKNYLDEDNKDEILSSIIECQKGENKLQNILNNNYSFKDFIKKYEGEIYD